MTEKTEALRLADLWEKHSHGYALTPEAKTAAELRRLAKVEAQRDALLEALKDTTAHLVAAVSLLERGSKKAAASDRMFDQMLIDYTNSFERARAAIKAVEEGK